MAEYERRTVIQFIKTRSENEIGILCWWKSFGEFSDSTQDVTRIRKEAFLLMDTILKK